MMAATVDVADRSGATSSRLDDLYVRHAPRARALAFVLTGDRDAADDLVHEAFVRLAGRFRHLRRPEAFPSYLRSTVVNLHLSALRRLRLERQYAARRTAGPEAHDLVADVPAREDLWRALRTLPPRQRAALVLRYYEDLTERETAEIMRCSVAAAKSLVTRGLEGLRTRIESEEG